MSLKITKSTTSEEISDYLSKARLRNNEEAYNDGRFVGNNKEPMSLGSYKATVEMYKSKNELLLVHIFKTFMPAYQLPAGKLLSEKMDRVEKEQGEKIKRYENEAGSLRHEIGKGNPKEILRRKTKANLILFLWWTFDTVASIKSFEASSDKFIIALFMSGGVSFLTCILAHYAGKLYQRYTKKRQRIIITIVAIFCILALSLAMASMRAVLFNITGVKVNPYIFVIFNFLFFLGATLTTYITYPTDAELKANSELINKQRQVDELEKKSGRMAKDLAVYLEKGEEKKLTHLQGIIEPEYLSVELQIMFKECVNEFKRGYFLSKRDMPEFFNMELPRIEIDHITVHGIINKYKNNNNENND